MIGVRKLAINKEEGAEDNDGDDSSEGQEESDDDAIDNFFTGDDDIADDGSFFRHPSRSSGQVFPRLKHDEFIRTNPGYYDESSPCIESTRESSVDCCRS